MSEAHEKLCPICRRRPAVEAYRPFCSKRCANVDLNRWLSGAYVVPAAPETDEEEEPGDKREEEPRSEE